MSKLRRGLKWALWIIAGLLLLVILSVAALLYSLRSGAITEYGLAQATPYLSPLGIEVDRLDRARIDPLHFVYLSDLALRWQDDNQGEVSVVLGEAIIEYDAWSLMDDQFQVSRFELNNVQIRAELTLPETETADDTTDEGVLAPIEALLNSPPLALLSAENIEFKSIALDIILIQGTQRIHYQGSLEHLTSELHWDTQSLAGALAFDLSSQSSEQLQITETRHGVTSQIQLRPNIATKLQGQWLKTSQQWQFDAGVESKITLADVLIKQHQGDEQLDLTTEQLTLSLHSQTQGQLDSAFTTSFEFDLDAHPIALDQQLSAKESQRLQVQPNFKITGQANIADLDRLTESLKLSATPQLKLNDLSIIQRLGTETQTILSHQAALNLNTQLNQGAVKLKGALALTGLQVSDVNITPLTLDNSFQLDTDLDFKKITLAWNSQLDQQTWLELQINADNAAKLMQVTHDITLQIPTALPPEWRKHEALQSITDQIGSPLVEWAGHSQVTHSASSILNVETDVLMSTPLTSQGSLLFTQRQPPTHPEGISLGQPLRVTYTLKQTPRYHINLKINAPSLQTPPLLTPMPVQFTLNSQLDWPLSHATAQGQFQIEGQEALNFDLALADFADHFTLQGEFGLYATPDWQDYAADLASLSPLGEVRSQGRINARFNSAFQAFVEQEITPKQLMAQSLSLALDTTVTQAPGLNSELIQLNQPLVLTQQLKLAQQQMALNTTFTLADAWLPQGLDIKQLSGQLNLKAPASETPDQVQLSLQLEPATLVFESADVGVLDVSALATPLALDLSAHTLENEFTIEHLNLSTGHPFLNFTAIAQGDMEGGYGQLESVLSLALDHLLLNDPKLWAQGDVDMPLQINFTDSQLLSIDSELRFNDFNLTSGTTAIQALNGTLSIEEELLWQDKTLSFRYLVPTDPFQRVDYSLIEPYLGNQRLSFNSLSQDHIRTGTGLVGFSLKQNLFRLQPFELDLFGGHVSGQLYVDATPNAWQMGLLSRITEVDLRQFLPPDSPLRGDELSPVSARTALTFDIQQRLLQGRIDVSKISRAQLLQMLEIIDPDYQDPQLATVRSGLRFAYPEQLRITMQSGLMDMQIKLSALPKAISVRNLPLTPLINHFGAESFSELDAMPLK